MVMFKGCFRYGPTAQNGYVFGTEPRVQALKEARRKAGAVDDDDPTDFMAAGVDAQAVEGARFNADKGRDLDVCARHFRFGEPEVSVKASSSPNRRTDPKQNDLKTVNEVGLFRHGVGLWDPQCRRARILPGRSGFTPRKAALSRTILPKSRVIAGRP